MSSIPTSEPELLTDDSIPAHTCGDEAPSRCRLTPGLVARLALLFVTTRLAVVFVAVGSISISNGQQSIYGAFTKWDSAWYGFIAEDGYPTFVTSEAGGGNRWAFFPAWPTLMRLLHAVVGGSWQRNGIILAILLGFATTVLVYMAVADALGEDIAFKSTLLFLVAPSAAVMSMVYSEVLFVPCCVACVFLLGRERWLLAGVAAMVGSATRIAGLALVAVCLVEAFLAYRRTRSLRPFIAPLVAPLGLVAFVAYQRLRAGSWTAYSTAQSYWGNGYSAGKPVLLAFRDLLTSTGWRYPPNVLVPVVVVLVLAAGVALARTPKVPTSWWVLTIVLVGMALSPSSIYSIPRLFLPVFPLFAGAASKIPARYFPLVAAGSAVMMAVVGMLYFNTVGFQMAP